MMEHYALLLIDHGSKRAEANETLAEVAALVRDRLHGNWIVEVAHMELAEPSIDQGFARCVEAGATTILAHPFMLAKGRHAQEDVPRLVAEAAAKYGVKYRVTDPLGAHPGLAEAVIARAKVALHEGDPEA